MCHVPVKSLLWPLFSCMRSTLYNIMNLKFSETIFFKAKPNLYKLGSFCSSERNVFWVKVFGVKIFSHPFQGVSIFLIFRVLQDFQQIFIASYPSAVLGDGCPFSRSADRILPSFFFREDFFKPNFYLPVVSEIVCVQSNLIFQREIVREFSFLFRYQRPATEISVIVTFRPYSFELPGLWVLHFEFVQMVIIPIHRSLDSIVEVHKGIILRHQDSPPDLRGNAFHGKL